MLWPVRPALPFLTPRYCHMHTPHSYVTYLPVLCISRREKALCSHDLFRMLPVGRADCVDGKHNSGDDNSICQLFLCSNVVGVRKHKSPSPPHTPDVGRLVSPWLSFLASKRRKRRLAVYSPPWLGGLITQATMHELNGLLLPRLAGRMKF